jgi:protein-S-isoprenylcysteine O-methyltransferase Ste14
VAIAGVIISALTYRTQVKLEKGLLVKFGDDYKRYMEKVPRMNPLLGVIRLLRRKLLSNR